ncbi:DENN domain-containing protein 2C isoform X1 [Rattus norvegicus]|uniref:DENN domain containing 2C n=2 Tax=Rattus norvegicus TaxID=10116 RepID=D3ZX30_RAT|nr:DENN domain-containing protein 2C [Rattus norvegicus]XP_006233131.1 DENN domain-containing protein 2C isoform X1 [Rattus norvegicus]XP_006233132.1 DENN domain-containing protein 2C isoform X1 [Rattus norvegicus]XP_006233133.1 DENN domain-containing protein 2C isoform X1 [Rattus norvegicus]XP_038957997.1 DENN domain-containing protein 2C isoform X1 [Rattus norvegicus]XP_038957998.1 DENN domain-containing protein 2C isoform X1 [Rattus norvegicus]|eukprot:NP_001178498.1 DENN domain-containing protein 2C [Rattus norvegicus]
MHPTGTMDVGFTRSAVQTLSRSHCKNIKQKISQWEGRANGVTQPAKFHPKDFGVRYNNCHQERPPHKHPTGEERNGGLPRNTDARSHDQSEGESESRELKDPHPLEGEPNSSRMCARVKQIESCQAVAVDPEASLPPGNFYTSQIPWKSIEGLTPNKVFTVALSPCDFTEEEPELSVLDSSYRVAKSLENIYCEPEGQECGPSINPLPKPRRTFRYLSESDGMPYKERNCDQKNCESVCCADSSLASFQDPEPKRYGGKIRGRSKRKSFEFEDIQHFRNSRKIHEELERNAGSALYYTQSEDNIYEDIIYPAKENPYEDIPVQSFPIWRSPSAWRLPPAKSAFRTPKLPPKPQFLQRKTMELKNTQAYLRSKLTKDTTLPVTLTEWKLFRAGEVANRKKRNLPRLVLKINDTFESKRGKKRVKLQPYTGKEAPSSKGETSGNESDAEYLPKNRHKRLAQLQQSSKRSPHYQTLERDLIELQEQQLFELFVVVSLQKKASGMEYMPRVIQQFPSKGDHGYKQSKDTEERLKVIPRFCFPDSEDCAPTLELKSETFSFVLTGEDGSRWFGYCKKLLPEGRGKRLPEVYCMVSRLGCFNLFSKILDEVEKRREMSPALVYPFMRSVMEAPFPAPGRTITVKSYLPGAGDESIELCRPLDSRLEHVDFECLFKCLSVRHLIRVCASLLLERRVIFVADSLSTLSKCGHAVVATLYPFTWQHTYIPVLPVSMIDIVCSPTPFFIGILSCSLPLLQDLPIEEVLIVDLCADKFLQEVSDEDEIMPPKLQAALVQILEERDEVLAQERQFSQDVTLNSLVSEAFVRFFVELVGHYSLNMTVTERGERVFLREPFRKSHTSRSVRHFLDLFMETQMFAGFVQDRELRQSGVKGLFEVRALQYLETIPESEPSGVNRILRSLGSKMRFLHKK